MPPKDPVSATVDADVERSVEIEIQARRDEYSLGISRYVAFVCGAMSILIGGLWFLAQLAPQVLIYAGLSLLLALSAGFYPAFQHRKQTTIGLSLVYGVSLLLIVFSPLLIPSLMAVICIRRHHQMVDAAAGRPRQSRVGGRLGAGLSGRSHRRCYPGLASLSAFGDSIELWVTGTLGLVVTLTGIVVIRLIVLGLERQYRRGLRLNFEVEQQNQILNDAQATLKQERNLAAPVHTIPANVYIKDTQSRFVEADLETALQWVQRPQTIWLAKLTLIFSTCIGWEVFHR